MNRKKILSIVLALSLMVGMMPVFAEEIPSDTYEYWEEPTPIPQNEVYNEISEDMDEEEITADNTSEAEITEEIIYDKLDLSELEALPAKESFNDEDGISPLSTEADDKTIWDAFHTEQFGDDFLNPYGRKKESKQVSGNSNRFVIEETDLSLEGKNGLNVEIIRRHDNQLFDWSFRSVKTTGDGKMDISIGKFRRSDNHKEIYVGFLSEDDYYTYMYDGMMVKEMTRVRETEDGIEFYLFNELYKKRTDTGIYLYDVSYGIERETQYNYPAINSLSEFYNSLRSYSIGEDWELLLPEASLFRYDKYVDGDFKSYEAIGVFRGMDGVVYGFNGTQSFTENEDGSYKYTSTLRFDDNKYLSISKSYGAVTK